MSEIALLQENLRLQAALMTEFQESHVSKIKCEQTKGGRAKMLTVLGSCCTASSCRFSAALCCLRMFLIDESHTVPLASPLTSSSPLGEIATQQTKALVCLSARPICRCVFVLHSRTVESSEAVAIKEPSAGIESELMN